MKGWSSRGWRRCDACSSRSRRRVDAEVEERAGAGTRGGLCSGGGEERAVRRHIARDRVLRIRGVGESELSVRRVGVDRLGVRVGEEHLRRGDEPIADMGPYVDMHGAAAVPARVHRLELDDAVGVGRLGAPQEGGARRGVLAAAVVGEGGVVAGGVAMPDLDRAGERSTLGVHQSQSQSQRMARRAFGDIAAHELLVEREGAGGEFRQQWHCPASAKSAAVNAPIPADPLADPVGDPPAVVEDVDGDFVPAASRTADFASLEHAAISASAIALPPNSRKYRRDCGSGLVEAGIDPMFASAPRDGQTRSRAGGGGIRQAGAMSISPARVGILAPMPSELAPVVKVMGLARDADGIHGGRVGGVEVVAMRTGMGLALATAAATRLLDHANVDHVMVVGIAGGLGPTRVGELVCPEIVIDRSTDVEFHAAPLVAGAGRISSSDEFVIDPELVNRMVASGVRAVDMETSAVAAVCTARRLRVVGGARRE